jgi:hypothetical protein
MKVFRCYVVCCSLFTALTFGSLAQASPEEYFGIHIVDDQTGRGVPLVKLQTTSKIRYITDSNGYVAFLEPGLMDQDVYFGISSWGYEAKEMGFGFRGAVLHTTPGKEMEIKIHRLNIAERMYRLTGEGIYRDTVLLGKTPPIQHPLLDGKVMGSDTVETAVYRGKMYWFWGDTDCPNFPLGLYSTSGATSLLPAKLDLDRGIDYTYFVNPKSGFARAMIKVDSTESQPIWVDGMMVVPDQSNQEHMLCHFVRTKNLKVQEQGIAVFNDTKEIFEQAAINPLGNLLEPGGRPLRAMSNGKTYYYFPGPFLTKRVLADFEHAKDISTYEGFTCLKPGTDWSEGRSQVNRDDKGRLIWRWQVGATPIGREQFSELVKDGLVKADESPYEMKDVEHGKAIRAVEVTVGWNPFLKKWTLLCGQSGGDSNLGEIWLAVGNSPQGPWSPARKVATHAMKNDNNDFYNPTQHPEFMQKNGRIIYFEGTFVTTFSGNPVPTPRYDYNQILYCIDLSDPRLALPEPPAGLTDTQPAP